MSTRPVILIAAGALALAPFAGAQEDRAVPRGGASSSGGGSHPSAGVHSSGGGSHPSSGASSSSGSGSNHSSSSSSSTAQRRHPRAGTGSGHGGGYYPGYPVYPGYSGWGGGYYYPGWGYSYWWPYSGWYGGYWGYPGGNWGYPGSFGGSAYHYAGEEASVRVLVDPSEARVYVDGYYTGTVDDFDGLFQRLRLSPGRHEITLKLEGYKTHRVRVYLTPSHTLKLSYEMQRGQGETFEDLARDVPEREVRREREPAPREEEDVTLGEGRSGASAVGRLRLDVEPEDASVYVDGAFRGTGREATSLSLAPGRHRVEVVRPGYRTDERDVEITLDEPTEISVRLVRMPI